MEKFGDHPIAVRPRKSYPLWHPNRWFVGLIGLLSGYIVITQENEGWHVQWTSHPEKHSLLLGSAWGVTFDKETGGPKEFGMPDNPWWLSGVWHTALTMHPARHKKDIAYGIKFIRSKVETAWKHNINKDK